MKSTATALDGSTIKRTQFGAIHIGDVLYHQSQRLGKVVSTERAENTPSDVRAIRKVTLDDGTVLTRRGWQSKRLWKKSI